MKQHFVIAIYSDRLSAARFHKLAKTLGSAPEDLAKSFLVEGINSRRRRDSKFNELYKTIYRKKQKA